MDDAEFDKQNSNVVILCENYLQEDSNAMMLLNRIIHLMADFALIEERAFDDKEFDYAKELQELIFASKMMNHEMETHNLLLMGNYGEYVAKQQEKDFD